MDGGKFDALTRSLSNPTNRRVTLQGLAVGLLGLGFNRNAAAQFVAEGCKVRRCKKKVLGQGCLDSRGNPDNHKCCQGLKCSNAKGVCVFQNDHGEVGDYCRRTEDCDPGNCCKRNQCVPNKCGC
jgi:hypothetical protein